MLPFRDGGFVALVDLRAGTAPQVLEPAVQRPELLFDLHLKLLAHRHDGHERKCRADRFQGTRHPLPPTHPIDVEFLVCRQPLIDSNDTPAVRSGPYSPPVCHIALMPCCAELTMLTATRSLAAGTYGDPVLPMKSAAASLVPAGLQLELTMEL